MTLRALEQRVAALEQDIAELKAALSNGGGNKDWQRTVGMFSGDEVMKRIADHALQFREEDRRKARRGAKRAKSQA